MTIARTAAARRILTTSLAAAGIAALALAPTAAEGLTAVDGGSSASAAESTLGPDGYSSLELGMSEEEAVDTGLLTDRQEIGACTWFYLDPAEGEQNPGAGVVVSPTHGVVSIPGTQSTRTPEGITMGSVAEATGSTTEQIENGYDRYTVDKTGLLPLYTAPAPGNSQAHYIFAIGDDDRVKDMALTADDDGGCGLND
ncbi:hypothetical protein [Brachybacterium sp. P6-10-X1]|uniref:hypothetical protein n=1 Tax=Brachybacterium sp. P6-10-X1 TaxID=1903186 RepID=UPI0012F85C8C|nr:hypothetical protein [Brachybacterium sp. P6-10-X1]